MLCYILFMKHELGACDGDCEKLPEKLKERSPPLLEVLPAPEETLKLKERRSWYVG
jgi:hypothetical protein